MILDISGLSARFFFFERVLWMVLPLLTCSHYNRFLNSPTLLRLLAVSFKLATRTQTSSGWFWPWSMQRTWVSVATFVQRRYFHSLFADEHPSRALNKKGWKGANMPPPAEVLVSWAVTWKACPPPFFVLVYFISFSWISHFCIRFFVLVLAPRKLCTGLCCSLAKRQCGTPIFRPWEVDLWKGSKKISKESRIWQTFQTHSDQGKTFQKQKKNKTKKNKREQLAICECLRTHKKTFVKHLLISHGELGRGEGFSKFSF